MTEKHRDPGEERKLSEGLEEARGTQGARIGMTLSASVVPKPGNATQIRFRLPNGNDVSIDGPSMPPDRIGPLQVVFYPEEGVHISLAEEKHEPHRFNIPIKDLPLS